MKDKIVRLQRREFNIASAHKQKLKLPEWIGTRFAQICQLVNCKFCKTLMWQSSGKTTLGSVSTLAKMALDAPFLFWETTPHLGLSRNYIIHAVAAVILQRTANQVACQFEVFFAFWYLRRFRMKQNWIRSQLFKLLGYRRSVHLTLLFLG